MPGFMSSAASRSGPISLPLLRVARKSGTATLTSSRQEEGEASQARAASGLSDPGLYGALTTIRMLEDSEQGQGQMPTDGQQKYLWLRCQIELMGMSVRTRGG